MPLSARSRRSAVVLAAALIVAGIGGCKTWPAAPDAAQATQPADQSCVRQCDLAKTQCEQRQRQREEECQTHAQHASQSETGCRSRPGHHCQHPVPCLGADLSICKVQYDECIPDCTMRPAPKEDAAPPADQPAPKQPPASEAKPAA